MNELPNIIGIIGVAMILSGYFFSQTHDKFTKTIYYSSLNLLGAILILFSLFYHWNLASVIIEIFWILISCLGIIRFIKRRK